MTDYLGLINSCRALLTDSVIYFFISIRTPYATPYVTLNMTPQNFTP
jgi:hypothetical protein